MSLTLTVTNQAPQGRILLTPGNTSAAAVNTIERANDAETGGAYITLTDSLAYNEAFSDYNVASGQTYLYRLSQNVSGTVTQASGSGSIILTSAWIHCVSRTKRANNADYIPLALNDQAPHDEASDFAIVQRLRAGLEKVDLALGEIEQLVWSFTAAVPGASDTDRGILKRIWQRNAYKCIRDIKGNKRFGVLGPYRETYDFGLTWVPLVLTEVAYSEGIS